MNATITTPVQPTGTYTIDPGQTTIGFVTRHAIVTKINRQKQAIHASRNPPGC